MRVLRDAVLVLVGSVLFLSGIFVLLPYFGAGAAGSEVTGRGIAVATSCRFSGPVTEISASEPRFVFGWWWTCEAEMRWNDGSTETRTLTHSQLTDEDIGHRVRVVEREESAAARSPATRSVVYRADFEPRPVLGGAAVIGTALAAFVIAAPAHRIVTRLRGRGRSGTRAAASDG